MSSAFRRTLPARPDLDHQRKLAKELIRACRAGDGDAIARMRAELPDKAELSLADAQFVLAREYGFASWRELKDQIEKQAAAQRPPLERFKRAVRDGDAKAARALLEQYKEVRSSVDTPIYGFDSPALVTGSKHVDLVDVLLEFGADPNRKSSWWAGGFHPLYGATGIAAEHLIAAGAVPDACAAAHLDWPELLSVMLAEDPARVHERGGDGQMPLHFARSRRVVDLLLDAGADPDARDIDHRSTAAEWMLGDDPDTARLELARYLVERGASADIFLAAALGLTERARAMLESRPSLLQLRTSQGDYGEKSPSSYHIYQWTIGPNMSPLQVAAKFGQGETRAVMERYASTEERLLLACHVGDGDAARAIVGAHPGIVEKLGPVERRALTDEAWATNAPAVELLLELGFDPAVPSVSGPTGGTALHCAAWEGSVACVEAILRRPAGRALLETRDPTYGGTPLSWCSHGSVNCGNRQADHAAVARLLIAAGTRVDSAMAEWEGSDAFQAVIDEARDGNPARSHMNTIVIRPASVRDASGIADVLVQSWRTTYSDIVAQNYIDGLSVESQTKRWQARLGESGGSSVAVVAHEETGRIVGFAAGGRIRTQHENFDAELYALYIVAEAQGRGLGRRLLAEWASLAISGGFQSAMVRVLAANPACAFYERLGARALKPASIELDGVSYPETWYGWDRLDALTGQ